MNYLIYPELKEEVFWDFRDGMTRINRFFVGYGFFIDSGKVNYYGIDDEDLRNLTFLHYGDDTVAFIGETLNDIGCPITAIFASPMKFEHTWTKEDVVALAKKVLEPGAAYPYTDIDYCLYVG